jgi:hypothetical protein
LKRGDPVTDPAAPDIPTPPKPIPDLGFFSAPAQPRADSSFGISSFGSAPAQAPFRPPRTVPEPAPSRLSGRTVALLLGVVALVVVGVVGGVVMAMRGQDAAEPTTIAMPAQAGAFTKVGVDSPDNPSAFLTANTTLVDVQAGVYQRRAVRAAVVGARARTALTMSDQERVIAAFSRAIEERTGSPVTLVPVHVPLGGIFSCGQVSQVDQEGAANTANTVSTACVATSPGAVVSFVIVGEDYQVATKDASALLKAVESKG